MLVDGYQCFKLGGSWCMTTWPHIPKEHNFNIHCNENPESNIAPVLTLLVFAEVSRHKY
jgi:hypothetical protein